MGKRAGWSWWASLGFSRRSVRDANDFGDMGTAFGLDASLAGDTDIGTETQNGRSDPEAPTTSADRLNRRSAR